MEAKDMGLVVSSQDAIEAAERASIDVQITTAKKFPRTLSSVQKRVLEISTISQETAESCFYAISRGGDIIVGPTVRLAEIVAASYGNLRSAARVISVDATHVTCQGACHDLENNVAVSCEVKGKITNKNGKRFSEDMITLTMNSTSAKAFRNAIFKVVPMALLESTQAQIKKVGMGDERTLSARREAAIDYFNRKDVETTRVLALIGCSEIEDVTLEHLARLNMFRAGIQEGTSTIAETFPPLTKTPKNKPGRQSMKKEKPEPQTPPPVKQEEAPPESAPEATGLVLVCPNCDIEGTAGEEKEHAFKDNRKLRASHQAEIKKDGFRYDATGKETKNPAPAYKCKGHGKNKNCTGVVWSKDGDPPKERKAPKVDENGEPEFNADA